MVLLKVENLKHSYADKEVLKGISFQIKKGECFALLGPNGAGKSTTISLLLNYLNLKSGSIDYQGTPASDFSSRYLRSCTPQDARFSNELKVKEIVESISHVYPNAMTPQDCLKEYRLESISNRKTGVLSGGQRKLLSLACALMAGTPLVLLDEPTTGLDIETRFWVWEKIKEYKDKGGAVLLTTHHLEEADYLSDQVAFLYQGRIVKKDSFKNLKKETNLRRISFHYKGEKALPDQFEHMGGSLYSSISKDCISVTQDLLNNYTPEDLRIEDVGLEKIFQNLIAKGEGLET